MGSGETALKNKLRKMIYNHVIAYPGVSFNTLKTVFDLTDGNLRYHLDYLVKHGKIHNSLEQGTRSYYPDQQSITKLQKTGTGSELYNLTPQQERMLNTIKNNPGINQKELVHRTRINRAQAAKNLNKLSNLNLVKKNYSGKNVFYEYASDSEMKFKMMKRLVIKLLRDEIDEETFLKLKRRLVG